MYWKMSIDLSHPLVSSMGQHDALDALVTFNELMLNAPKKDHAGGLDLSSEIADVGKILSLDDLPTNDTLGMGGLITDAARVAQIEKAGIVVREGLLEALIDASLISIESFSLSGSLRSLPENRLAFRELGLSIGLKGIPLVHTFLTESTGTRRSNELLGKLTDLERFAPIGRSIDEFWTAPRNQTASTWSEHREINMVMLATSLAPDSFLSI
jgi:hypothetical protein